MNTKGALATTMLLPTLGIILFVSAPVEARRVPCPGSDVVGLWHMNENGGSSIKDATENHHDGETYGTSWVSGMFGSGLYFDGDAYIDLGDDESLNSLTDLTIEAWVKPAEESLSGRSAGFAHIVHKYGYHQFDLQIWDGCLFGAAGARSWYHAKSTVSLEADDWAYVVFSFQHSDKERKLYINGAEVDTTLGRGTTGWKPGTLYFGRGLDFPTGQEYVGALDEVQLTARVLSSDEILNYYTGTREHCAARTVDIDIKPGSDLNIIDPDAKGLIPVAILTTDEFDATHVDVDSIVIAGRGVAERTEGSKPMVEFKDVDDDGDTDLLVQIEACIEGETWNTGTVDLTAETLDGTIIMGSDYIQVQTGQ